MFNDQPNDIEMLERLRNLPESDLLLMQVELVKGIKRGGQPVKPLLYALSRLTEERRDRDCKFCNELAPVLDDLRKMPVTVTGKLLDIARLVKTNRQNLKAGVNIKPTLILAGEIVAYEKEDEIEEDKKRRVALREQSIEMQRKKAKIEEEGECVVERTKTGKGGFFITHTHMTPGM